ncbi:hypothetical protein [Luteimonas terricola]|uniref:Lipoprotein n=1 Tax=Luteimonas terricola TaxID=645597 RepID=A0ABQ2EGF3_9GAMM|nr:hypothetical protein [Luteimonas terricola]GGK10268.1 hypothetical protein GCM10011394_19690 [Luteimonas terricola]
MKTRTQAALIATSAVLLAACASGGGMASKAAPQPYQAPDHVVQDAEYVAIVERVARRRGVSVRWFNPPTKRVGADSDSDGGVEAQ